MTRKKEHIQHNNEPSEALDHMAKTLIRWQIGIATGQILLLIAGFGVLGLLLAAGFGWVSW